MTSLSRQAIALIALIASASPMVAVRADTLYPPADVHGDYPVPPPAPPQVSVGHEGVLSNGPNCGVVSHFSDDRSIWLGHFSGGNVGPEGPIPGGVDWRNLYACFPTRETCLAWQKDMRSEFRGLEGYRSCLVIR